MVAGCLHHARSEVRERAILIGGLRWADPTLLGYFQGALATGSDVEALKSQPMPTGKTVAEALTNNVSTIGENQSLRRALDELRAAHGSAPSGWRWGEAHAALAELPAESVRAGTTDLAGLAALAMPIGDTNVIAMPIAPRRRPLGGGDAA